MDVRLRIRKEMWKDSVDIRKKISRTQTLLQSCVAKSLKSCRPQSKWCKCFLVSLLSTIYDITVSDNFVSFQCALDRRQCEQKEEKKSFQIKLMSFLEKYALWLMQYVCFVRCVHVFFRFSFLSFFLSLSLSLCVLGSWICATLNIHDYP